MVHGNLDHASAAADGTECFEFGLLNAHDAEIMILSMKLW